MNLFIVDKPIKETKVTLKQAINSGELAYWMLKLHKVTEKFKK